MKPAHLTSALLCRGRANVAGDAAPSGSAPQPHLPLLRTKPPRPVPLVAPQPRRPAGGAGKRVHMSVRLDRQRHLRLKLVAAHAGCSMQGVLVRALDEWIERHAPEVVEALRTVCRSNGAPADHQAAERAEEPEAGDGFARPA